MPNRLLNKPSIEFIENIHTSTPPQSIRVWGRLISQFYNDTCIITGLNKNLTKIERHHIYNVYDYPHLKLCLFNGICLTRDIHLLFHRLYGTRVSASDFLDFIQKLKRKPDFKQYENNLFEAEVWINLLENYIQDQTL